MARARRGFSLIEMLVVLMIVGVLGTLILPAVQAAREAALRIRCTNNLKQMGIALMTYHEVIGAFPMGYVAAPSPNAYDTSPGWSWAAMMLLQIEQTPLYNSANFKLPVELAANLTTRQAAVGVYICPADRDSGLFTVVRDGSPPIGIFHTNSYAACFGAGLEIDDFPDRGDGLFRRNLVVRHSDILDGTSSTIAIGERGACLVKTPWVGAPDGGISSFSDDAPAGIPDYHSIGHGAELVVAHAGDVGFNAQGTSPDDFYSPHSGGGNFLFADGSVRFVRSTIALDVYRALCTRAGGEVPNSDAY
jgi:prepilin-type N-terminal cleavage/methylation domain-containing protein/prepilin-type processing-associated H-X9-DG protein